MNQAIGGGRDIARVEIPMTSPLLDRLRAMPDAYAKKKKVWTDEEDAVLLEGRPRVSWGNICRLLKCSEDTARDRYRWLTEKGG
jgi:hypothetical protein